MAGPKQSRRPPNRGDEIDKEMIRREAEKQRKAAEAAAKRDGSGDQNREKDFPRPKLRPPYLKNAPEPAPKIQKNTPTVPAKDLEENTYAANKRKSSVKKARVGGILKMRSGGKIDGCATRGKTKGRYV